MALIPSSRADDGYDGAVRRIWRHAEPGSRDASGVLRALVHDATQVPSSHNAQCWRFLLEEGAISLLPDGQRRFLGRGPQMPRSLRRPIDAVVL